MAWQASYFLIGSDSSDADRLGMRACDSALESLMAKYLEEWGARSRPIGSICRGRVRPDLGEKSPGACRTGIAPGCVHKRDDLRSRVSVDRLRSRPESLRRHRR